MKNAKRWLTIALVLLVPAVAYAATQALNEPAGESCPSTPDCPCDH
jgi:hypothetical protein